MTATGLLRVIRSEDEGKFIFHDMKHHQKTRKQQDLPLLHQSARQLSQCFDIVFYRSTLPQMGARMYRHATASGLGL
jgi:hypothetical protein